MSFFVVLVLFGPCGDTVNAVTDICYRTPYSIKKSHWLDYYYIRRRNVWKYRL